METENNINDRLIAAVQKLLSLVIILVIIIILLPFFVSNIEEIEAYFTHKEEKKEVQNETKIAIASSLQSTFWQAPEINSISDAKEKELVEYGKDLIVHTAAYLGPKGSVKALSNGINCQSCHLEAGTKIYGNNYAGVASTYPKFRARSGQEETIEKRVNDCFERSLNGKALAEDSKEMKAIVAYMKFLGSNVEKGKIPEGSGLKELAFLDRAADPSKGKIIYDQKCAACHQENGSGMKNPDQIEYGFPPVWGASAYNEAAGLFRLSNMAKFVKYNMPLGATHDNPQLSDDEAWDVAAYINTQAHPKKTTPKDWPDVSKKPVDHPFGPYKDAFSEKEHKLGPFKPIKDFYSSNN
jgi:thiosulfate dehydrogenase